MVRGGEQEGRLRSSERWEVRVDSRVGCRCWKGPSVMPRPDMCRRPLALQCAGWLPTADNAQRANGMLHCHGAARWQQRHGFWQQCSPVALSKCSPLAAAALFLAAPPPASAQGTPSRLPSCTSRASAPYQTAAWASRLLGAGPTAHAGINCHRAHKNTCQPLRAAATCCRHRGSAAGSNNPTMRRSYPDSMS